MINQPSPTLSVVMSRPHDDIWTMRSTNRQGSSVEKAPELRDQTNTVHREPYAKTEFLEGLGSGGAAGLLRPLIARISWNGAILADPSLWCGKPEFQEQGALTWAKKYVARRRNPMPGAWLPQHQRPRRKDPKVLCQHRPRGQGGHRGFPGVITKYCF